MVHQKCSGQVSLGAAEVKYIFPKTCSVSESTRMPLNSPRRFGIIYSPPELHILKKKFKITKWHRCSWLKYDDLHLTSRETGLLSPSPSRLLPTQVYKPARDLVTDCKTKLWLLTIVPTLALLYSVMPCNSNKGTFCYIDHKTHSPASVASSCTFNVKPCLQLRLEESVTSQYLRNNRHAERT
jgi:hypothetical protein